ncbi:lipopolysaccharide biosynthesis protein [Cryobacterium sp. GrIS_2_6]|uniref:lipopolysaccharide biosynthesis protein n=1 Tax=Cryobacterium sp. GrIS_2_6 TaxID=3162785 RepID=UPI002DFD9EDF|nr:PST family polysaccharide transporter [Cryobacterium psychrotolerans]
MTSENEGLGRFAARGALSTVAGQVIRLAVQLVGVVILARLLGPTDYGLIAMVVAIVGVGEVLRDFGLSSAVMRAESLSVTQRNNLFWINTLIGAVLTIAIILLSNPIADLYGQPELVGICIAISFTFLLNGMATQYRAGLARNLKFGYLALVETAAPVLGLVVSVALAFTGFGYWALVWQQLVLASTGLILAAFLGRWLPGPYSRRAEMGSFFRFGANLAATQILNYASANIDSIVVGYSFGSTVLGFYNRAFQLISLPLSQFNAPATKVAVPILSRIRDDSPRLASFLIQGQSVLLHVVAATFAFTTAQASGLIDVALGPQWSASVPLFQILAVGGVAQSAGYVVYWIFLVRGHTGSLLRQELATRPIMITFIIVGSLWGTAGVAAGYAMGQILAWPFGLWWVRKYSVPALALFGNGLRICAYYAIAGLLSFFVSHALSLNSIGQLLVGASTFSLALVLLGIASRRYRADVALFAKVVRLTRR